MSETTHFDVHPDERLTFMPEYDCNFPIIPFELKSEEDYSRYKRICEIRLRDIYDNHPDLTLRREVVLGILRANINKRIEHASRLTASVPLAAVSMHSDLIGHGLDMRVPILPGQSMAPHIQRMLYNRAGSIEVGFRFVGTDEFKSSAFDQQRVWRNFIVAQGFLEGKFDPRYTEGTSEHKVTRVLGDTESGLAVVKTKLKCSKLLSKDGDTVIQSRGRRTGIVDLGLVEGAATKKAFRELAKSGSDESMSEADRESFRSLVRTYLIGRAGYRAVVERYYFTREDVSVESDR